MSMDALRSMMSGPSHNDRCYGVVVGLVVDVDDPENMARVRVKFPWLNEDDTSAWARIAVPMAGPERGFYALPEIDDEVLVAFEHGDMHHPYIVGALWNGKDAPPVSGDTRSDIRVWKSRSGHVVRFNDKDGGGKVEIQDSAGKLKIVMDVEAKSLTLEAGDGAKVVLDGSANSIKIEATGDISLESSGGTVKIKGTMVELN